MTKLIVKFKNTVLNEYDISKKNMTKIGRRPDNDIVIENIGVSKYHATIEISKGSYLLTDLESTNGTFVGDKKIKTASLKDNDTIIIGKHSIVFKSNKPLKQEENPADFGMKTMIIDTKQQKELLEKQKELHRAKQPQKEEISKILITECGRKKEYLLKKDRTTIGRNGYADIGIKGFFIPKLVASIKRNNSRYSLIVAESWTTVTVNGELPSLTWELKQNDIIEIRKATMIFT